MAGAYSYDILLAANHKVIRLGVQIGVKLHVLTSNRRNLTFSSLLREERELVKRIEERRETAEKVKGGMGGSYGSD